MKCDIIKTTIAVAMSALVAYGLYVWCVADNKILLSALSFAEMSVLLVSAVGLKIERVRSMVNVKIVAWIFFIAVLVMDILFARNEFKIATLIIADCSVLLVFILLSYSLIKSNY